MFRTGLQPYWPRWNQPRDIAWLAAFRILYGLSMAVSAERFLAFGWVERLFLSPTFHFKYYGFGWVEPLPPFWLEGLFYGLMVLGLCVALGLLFRVSLALFLLGFTYLELIDVTTYLNHYYLATLLGSLLLLSPANRAWSLDALLRPRLRTHQVASGWHWLLRFQVGVVYSFAGLAKLNSDWLLHAQPLRIWLSSRADMPLLGPLFTLEWTPLLMSWAGFLFDTTVPWFLLWRRTRPYAFAAVLGFHAVTSALFPIGMFPVIMVSSALVFFSPAWPRLLLHRVRGVFSPAARRVAPTRTAHDAPLGNGQALPRWAIVAALGYCALQLAIPLRFLAYGGDVRWHEQGMRFSWRVMVREKNGSVTFLVTSPSLGRTWHVSPSRYLTPLQEREMSSQPDLILQLAHHIADDFRRRGVTDAEVRAEALVSLNGRPLTPLVDPTVDLTRTRDGFGKATWIQPPPSVPPPHIRPI